jgi:ankyrin repeat protein
MQSSVPIAKRAYDAVKSGDLDALASMVDADSSVVNASTPFGSLLHVAADKGHLNIVRYLVQKGADINLNDGIVGGSPIGSAASSGHADVVKYLLEHGALLDVSEPNRNPLFGAIHGGHFEVASLLIDRGIDTSVVYNGENMRNMDAKAFAEEWGRTDILNLLNQR